MPRPPIPSSHRTRGSLPLGNGFTERTLKMLKGRRFSPAMIVAMIALAVALSETAVAGTTKLITGSQIANGTIKLAGASRRRSRARPARRACRALWVPRVRRGRSGRRAPPERRATRVQSALPELPAPLALRGLPGTVNAVKTAFCLNISNGSMKYVPGDAAAGTPCGQNQHIINLYMEG